MEIAEHWIQQVIRQGHVRVQHIGCKFNLADMNFAIGCLA
jgi:hypothetical protein